MPSPNMVTVSSISSTSTKSQVFDLVNPWCASGPVPQIITLYFNNPVYLTQLQVTGNSVNVAILLDINQTLYENTAGLSVSSSPCVSNHLRVLVVNCKVNKKQNHDACVYICKPACMVTIVSYLYMWQCSKIHNYGNEAMHLSLTFVI